MIFLKYSIFLVFLEGEIFVLVCRGIAVVYFSGASFGNLRRGGSMESCVSILGRAKSKLTDVSCAGHYIDSSARRISRVCRSSLDSEAIALGNSCDLERG